MDKKLQTSARGPKILQGKDQGLEGVGHFGYFDFLSTGFRFWISDWGMMAEGLYRERRGVFGVQTAPFHPSSFRPTAGWQMIVLNGEKNLLDMENKDYTDLSLIFPCKSALSV